MTRPDSDHSSIAALAAREAANNKSIAELQARIDDLTRENQRIADAIAVLREFGGGEQESESAAPPRMKMTVPDMISEAIMRKGAMTASEIIDIIKERWNPDIDSNTVRPTLWRITQAGRLRKRGDRYDLP